MLYLFTSLVSTQQNRLMKVAAAEAASTQEQQVLRLAHSRPLLRARDLTQQGLPTIALTRLVQAGKLERMAHGLYGLPGAEMSEHRSLAEVSARVPKAVVCLMSALRVHEIGTQAPHEVWIAIPPHMVSPRLDQPAIRVVRMSDQALAEGVDRLKIDGVDVPVFNAARTVVDGFRFRNKIGLDVALEALRDGWSQRKFTLDDLWRHAERGRVANVMRPYIEAITA
jgi:predicted transcriptional regulator of viral defense system